MRNTINILSALLIAGMFAALIGCDSRDTASEAGDYIDDTVITTKAKAALFGDDDLSGYEISVETENGVVQLSGFVSSQREIDKATRVVRGVEGVKSVDNSLRVQIE